MARRSSTAVVVLACAGLLAGCGGESPDRASARRYVEQVNALSAATRPEVDAASKLYKRFADQKLSDREASDATRANARAIRGARAKVAALATPPQARRLRGALLGYWDAQLDAAVQTALLADYVPAEKRALRPARELSRALSRALRDVTGGPPAQARGLRRYADGLKRIGDDLRALKPPLILRSARDAQLRRLAASRGTALSLRSAVLRRDPAAVRRQLARFRRANRRGLDPAATKAAYRAYTATFRGIGVAEGRVRQELARLDRATA